MCAVCVCVCVFVSVSVCEACAESCAIDQFMECPCTTFAVLNMQCELVVLCCHCWRVCVCVCVHEVPLRKHSFFNT